jgi:type I restriction enzyme M protein
VIVPHGVLFRGGAEGTIRQRLIEENLLDAVIGLPPNLFYGTGIPAAILLFKRNKPDDTVIFIDASQEFAQGTNQNKLRDGDVQKIVATYKARLSMAKYAAVVGRDRIVENEFNLNIPRYIETFESEEDIDIGLVQEEIGTIENQLTIVRQKIDKCLLELGI